MSPWLHIFDLFKVQGQLLNETLFFDSANKAIYHKFNISKGHNSFDKSHSSTILKNLCEILLILTL